MKVLLSFIGSVALLYFTVKLPRYIDILHWRALYEAKRNGEVLSVNSNVNDTRVNDSKRTRYST